MTSLRRPTGCPHCDAPHVAPHHFRDSGDLSPEAAAELGYCPRLAERRGGTAAASPWLASDVREAARFTEWADRLSDDDMAAAYAAALTAEAL